MQKDYRTGYPSDVNDVEWAFVEAYFALCREDAAQREHSLRAVFNGLRYIVKTGNQWRMMPHDLPPWPHHAIHSGIGRTSGLRRSETPQGAEGILTTQHVLTPNRKIAQQI
jgi:transposase